MIGYKESSTCNTCQAICPFQRLVFLRSCSSRTAVGAGAKFDGNIYIYICCDHVMQYTTWLSYRIFYHNWRFIRRALKKSCETCQWFFQCLSKCYDLQNKNPNILLLTLKQRKVILQQHCYRPFLHKQNCKRILSKTAQSPDKCDNCLRSSENIATLHK